MKQALIILALVASACAPTPEPQGSWPYGGKIAKVVRMSPPDDANVYQFRAAETGPSEFIVQSSASSGPNARISGGTLRDEISRVRSGTTFFSKEFLCADGQPVVLSEERFIDNINAWDMRVRCGP